MESLIVSPVFRLNSYQTVAFRLKREEKRMFLDLSFFYTRLLDYLYLNVKVLLKR